jgi:hypothetical protein
MSIETAEVELAHSPAKITAGAVTHVRVDDFLDEERPMRVARGIASAALISVPFWALFAFALYLLI